MKEKIAIWGTGNVCEQIMNGGKAVEPDCFIDNDVRKVGKEIYGVTIVHPSQITDWNELFVILALDSYIGIRSQLIGYGLAEYEDFIWYREWLCGKSAEQIVEEAEDFLDKIEWNQNYSGAGMIFSDFLAFDKGVCDFVNRWCSYGKRLVLLSEAACVSRERMDKMLLPIIELPTALLRNQYLKKQNGKFFFRHMTSYVSAKRYLRDAAGNLRMGYSDMAENYEFMVCYYADRIVRKIIECWKPSQVILWNAFYAFHFIIRNICAEKRISVRFMEFGNIPGTIIVEKLGQMGESWPARHPQEFVKISVSDKERADAEKLIRRLRRNGLNRNTQPQNGILPEIAKRLKSGRPVVFYAGQNDNASGMQPYTENTQKFHSPIFRTSDEAAVFLAKVCERNDLNYIYKPHPMMAGNCDSSVLPKSVIFVEEADINGLIDMSDVVVTILSTVSYVALIRQKPVVMLGYTQLKKQGCVYEAFDVRDIERVLLDAIKNRLNEDMRHGFIAHIARMRRFYSGGIVGKRREIRMSE